ncbi:glutaredoxin domain-containing protein [Caldifermentibacillus hisashii]|uniref:glutaredoxin family protein n=1 Tax=Caldifermentibacillus hisashii TaxID=996558 RepID=UPI002E1AA9CD|nr:glutaredoxin domain-containing protein [Caldifermentibacillus hisashii]MED4850328.1 glutaredoxin domain-containing protein [Caldifermentibacillus hisashii]
MKILKISKPHCIPCQNVENFLQDNHVVFEEIDIYKQPELILQYGLTGVPVTLLIDVNNNELERVVGYNPIELSELISQYKDNV